MTTILDTILQHKHFEVSERKKHRPLATLKQQIPAQPQPRGFINTLQQRIKLQQPAIIAEIKKASPSKGVIRTSFDPVAIAKSYTHAKATCLSVLTDEKFFQGHDEYLTAIRSQCELPVLRKDFIVDAYQIYETYVLGADCLLLIVAALDNRQLTDFFHVATELQLDVLVEVHNQQELDRALKLPAPLIGINNRDLNTFSTDLQTTLDLLPNIPKDKLVVTESGIHSRDDVQLMVNHGVYGFLVGEAMMCAADPGEKLKDLLGG